MVGRATFDEGHTYWSENSVWPWEGKRVYVLGGPRTLRAFHDLGGIDRVEILVLPILLSEGVPLFPLGHSRTALKLESQRSFPDGTVELAYATAKMWPRVAWSWRGART